MLWLCSTVWPCPQAPPSSALVLFVVSKPNLLGSPIIASDGATQFRLCQSPLYSSYETVAATPA